MDDYYCIKRQNGPQSPATGVWIRVKKRVESSVWSQIWTVDVESNVDSTIHLTPHYILDSTHNHPTPTSTPHFSQL